MCSPSKVKRQDKANEKDRWLTDTGVDIDSNKSTRGTNNDHDHHPHGASHFDPGPANSKKIKPPVETVAGKSFASEEDTKGSAAKVDRFALERYLKTAEPHEQLALGQKRSAN